MTDQSSSPRNRTIYFLLLILILVLASASSLYANPLKTSESQNDPAPAAKDILSPGKAAMSEGTGGRTWTEPVTGMEFVWIKGGCFQMGQTESEEQYLIKEVGKFNYVDWFMEELPCHKVCLDGFWMAKTEVTRGQFRQFVKAENFLTDAEKKGAAWIQNKSTCFNWEEGAGRSWKDPGYIQTDAHPVAAVSWNDANAFIRWLSRRSGQQFALPTEAQWEYAARAGTSSIRFWGRDHAKACIYANAQGGDIGEDSCFPCNDGYVFTAPAARFQPNPWGLYDMLGNVWEWCEDGYDPDGYSKHSQKNPVITSGSSARARRGGSWASLPGFLRAACREGFDADDCFSDMGFRLCLPQIREIKE